MKPVNRNNLCNKPYQYFVEYNLDKLYSLFDHHLVLDCSIWLNKKSFRHNQSYDNLVNHIKKKRNYKVIGH